MRLPVSVTLLTLSILAIDWIPSIPVSAKTIGNKDRDDLVTVPDYFKKLLPVANDTILQELGGSKIGAAVTQPPLSARPRSQFPDLFFFRQPGVVLTLLPDPQYADWAMFWFRDAAFIWHFWLNKLIFTGDTSFRPLVDDAVHAIIRAQHTSNRVGNVLTGGLAEGVYDRQIKKVLSANASVGSPGGGAQSLVSTCTVSRSIQLHRFGTPACFGAFKVC